MTRAKCVRLMTGVFFVAETSPGGLLVYEGCVGQAVVDIGCFAGALQL